MRSCASPCAPRSRRCTRRSDHLRLRTHDQIEAMTLADRSCAERRQYRTGRQRRSTSTARPPPVRGRFHRVASHELSRCRCGRGEWTARGAPCRWQRLSGSICASGQAWQAVKLGIRPSISWLRYGRHGCRRADTGGGTDGRTDPVSTSRWRVSQVTAVVDGAFPARHGILSRPRSRHNTSMSSIAARGFRV